MQNRSFLNIRQQLFVLSVTILLVALQSCIWDSDDVKENFYTFKGETVGSYLEKTTDTYKEFWKAVEKANLDNLLKTYNKYTCFAPNDSAMFKYYADQGVSSIDELSDSIVKYMVYSHLIADKVFYSTDFSLGALSSTNMNSRYLVVAYKSFETTVNVVINNNSVIVERDVEVENGVIHSIDRVLTPSTSAIPTIMGEDSRINLFVEALQKTGLDNELQLLRDDSYVPEKSPLSIDGVTVCRSPKIKKYGYTVFAETDEVFAKAGITDLESLKAYAASVYDAMYPEDAGINDITNRRNSLNRFVAYHIIDKTVYYNNFFYKANIAIGITLYEFMETFCPNTIFRVSNETGGVVINSDVLRGVKGVTVLPVESGMSQDTENGVYHLLDDILVYDQKVVTMLMNSRIRMDASSLHPELMTNGIRYEKGDDPSGITGASNYYKFPDGYLKNVEFLSLDTRLYYLQGNKTWVNYQADEMMAQGSFDFVMRFPPVPAGTYEIRFGYSANPLRGIIQFYVDDEPQGIPLNMKRLAVDPTIGWVADYATLDDGIENDKMMRNRGYMKGGSSYLMNSGTSSSRNHNGALRRIICTKTWDSDGPHYLRFKSVSEEGLDQFMIDYFEFVPKNVYNNPNGEAEDRL